MLLIHQHQARNLSEQQNLQRLFLTYLEGQLTAEQYERNLALTCAAKRPAPAYRLRA